jgi:hypothetical protein
MGFVMTKGPLFQHDCQACMFLGVWREVGEHAESFDIYFCQSTDGGSVIARFGDGGPEYASGPISALLYSDIESVLTKVAKWIMREGFVQVKLNKPWIRKKRKLNEGWWKLRKGQEYMG